MDGIINVYKERGFTSHDVVAKLRGILHYKKIGHTGTLDPEAVGVLPVCVGKATKVCELLTDKDKTYRAGVKLGVVTDTYDLTGEVLSREEASVTEEELLSILREFTGNLEQVPPMYSAVKVNGKRLYELARQGKEIERKARPVFVYECRLLQFHEKEQEFEIEVTCSKGTYIRSLCHDIGQRLGCGAAMKSLIRTRVGMRDFEEGDFRIEDALTLAQIEENVREGRLEMLRPIDSVFLAYPACRVREEAMKFLENGGLIAPEFLDWQEKDRTAQEGNVRMYGAGDEFYAIYRFDRDSKKYRIVKMFH